MAGQYESPDYGQFTPGNFSFGDTWGSGQGLNQGQYQSLADALGYNGTCLLPFGLMSGTTATTITGSIQVMDR